MDKERMKEWRRRRKKEERDRLTTEFYIRVAELSRRKEKGKTILPKRIYFQQ